MSSVKASYLLLPYLRLSEQQRIDVINQEIVEGKNVWVDMQTTIDGIGATVNACKEWGVFLLGNQMIVLPEYPLQDISNVSFDASPGCDNQQ